ncbi:MAG: hypothetical protein M3229_02400 [Actinomycetota bacterium]|nr:hypothetical protein [Actinomycetota bacterium]
MRDDTTALIDRVHALIDAPLDGTPGERASIEYTLTEGYARALALEAERRRIDERITELTTLLRADDQRRLSEFTALAQRRSRAEGEISRLRALLRTLRERLAAAAAAALL